MEASIGAQIRAIRKKAAMTQAELGDKLGTTDSYISQIESGIRNPKISTIQRIAAALEVPVSILLAPILSTESERSYEHDQKS